MSQEGYLSLKTLGDFSRFLHGNWEREVVLVELLRIFEEVIECSRASVYLFENGNFELKGRIGEPIKLDSPEILNESDKYVSFFNSENHSCESVLLNDKDLLLTPLVCKTDIFGLLLYKLNQPSKVVIELVTVLATLVSVALKNASQADEKKMVDGIVSTFASGLDLHMYYPQFAEKLKQIFPFDTLTITIPDPFNRGSLLLYNGSERGFHTDRLPYEGSAPARVISTGNTIIEDDLASNRDFIEDESLFQMGIRCALRVPLNSKGKTIGTLNIGSRLPYIYKKREIDLFTEVACKIGPAVENALVYDAINKKLSIALVSLENNFSATLDALAIMLDSRDAGTKGHSIRVIKYAATVAKRMGITGIDLKNIRLGALLHDIGKIAIPDSILFKPGKLSEQEWLVMKTHPKLGAEMVSKVEFLSPAIPVVLHHHEWFNGNGYPAKLMGHNIPLGARIFALADALDAMTSDRPYRKAIGLEQAVSELKRCRANQFCPDCMDAFVEIPASKLADVFNSCQEVAFSPYLVSPEISDEMTQ